MACLRTARVRAHANKQVTTNTVVLGIVEPRERIMPLTGVFKEIEKLPALLWVLNRTGSGYLAVIGDVA